jgi:hypothetical protein
MQYPSDDCARAEALFVSCLQASDQLTPEIVSAAVAATLGEYGPDGCAAAVAFEFGEHPDMAARRMAWARCQLDKEVSTAGLCAA